MPSPSACSRSSNSGHRPVVRRLGRVALGVDAQAGAVARARRPARCSRRRRPRARPAAGRRLVQRQQRLAGRRRGGRRRRAADREPQDRLAVPAPSMSSRAPRRGTTCRRAPGSAAPSSTRTAARVADGRVRRQLLAAHGDHRADRPVGHLRDAGVDDPAHSSSGPVARRAARIIDDHARGGSERDPAAAAVSPRRHHGAAGREREHRCDRAGRADRQQGAGRADRAGRPIDPTEPIERIEPSLAIERIEPREPIDHRESMRNTVGHAPDERPRCGRTATAASRCAVSLRRSRSPPTSPSTSRPACPART